jgi:hypothetical protein
MKRLRPPHVESRVTKAGVTHWYFRRGKGPTTPICSPDDPGFLAAYAELMEAKRPISRRNIAALIGEYCRSPKWDALAPRTRADYGKVLSHIETVAGKADVTAITRPAVLEARDRNRHRARFANYIVQVYSILCEHAVDLGWLPRNPVKGTALIPTPKEKKRPHIPWPNWAVDRFRGEASSFAVLAFELGVGSVQRPEDLTRLTWPQYDGTNLRIAANKTGAEGIVPCTPQLKAALDGAVKVGFYILPGKDGRPMSYHTLARRMLAERKRLGCEAFDMHAMRYRGIMELAWAGCSDDEIASYSLHASKQMIALYAGKARQVTRARSAAAKRKSKEQ